MNNKDHLSGLSNSATSAETTAGPADKLAVHTSFAGVEEDDNFADEVNG